MELLNYTNKWRSKFLKLVKENNDFKLILTRRNYNPQTETTYFSDFCLMNIGHKETAIKVFDDYRKGHKLTINEVER